MYMDRWKKIRYDPFYWSEMFEPVDRFRLRPCDVTKLFAGRQGKQSLDLLVREGFVRKEFLVDGEWVETLNGVRPSGVVYCPGENQQMVESIARAWRDIKRCNEQQPADRNGILDKLTISRARNEPLTFFSPWGPRYKKSVPEIAEDDAEINALKVIRTNLRIFRPEGYDVRFLLMPADAYGTEVNSLDPQFVDRYFNSLASVAQEIVGSVADVEVKRWSEIRAENIGQYEARRPEIERGLLDEWPDEYQEALRAARQFNPDDATASAMRYCVERIIEAEIIQEQYDPIKLSLVRKEKDALDGSLKRIYVIPNRYRAPWLKGD